MGEPSNNLYARGLPDDVSEHDVRELFSSYGAVHQCRVMPPGPNQRTSAALIRMGSVEEAEAAIAALNGASVPQTTQQAEVKPLTVRYHGKGTDAPPSDNLYVKGLPAVASESDVRDVFSDCGIVISVRLMAPRPPATDATALVRMNTQEEAAAAIALLNGADTSEAPVATTELQVRFAENKGAKLHAAAVADTPVVGALPTYPADQGKGTGKGGGGSKSGGCCKGGSGAAVVPAPPPTVQAGKGAASGPPPPRGVPPVVIPATHVAPEIQSPVTGQSVEVRFHGPKTAPPSDNLYVKGLPVSISQQQMRAMFGECGNVTSVRIMMGHSDATALVRMGSVEEAAFAIEALNGADMSQAFELEAQQQRAASAAASAPPKPPSYRQPPVPAPRLPTPVPAPRHTPPPPPEQATPSSTLEVRYHGPKGAPASDNLYVKGLPSTATEAEVRDTFASCGTVVSVRTMAPRPPATDVTALVRMSSMEEASVAIIMFDGSPVVWTGPAPPAPPAQRGAIGAGPQPEQQQPPPPKHPPPPQHRPPPARASSTPPHPAVRVVNGLEVRYHGKGTDAPPSDNLYIKGLPMQVSESEIKKLFSTCGTVLSVRVLPPRPPATDSAALVRMSSQPEAAMAIAVYGTGGGGGGKGGACKGGAGKGGAGKGGAGKGGAGKGYDAWGSQGCYGGHAAYGPWAGGGPHRAGPY